MKRFLVFSGTDYYPGGGVEDFDTDFDTLEYAKMFQIDSGHEWANILDTKTGDTHLFRRNDKWRTTSICCKQGLARHLYIRRICCPECHANTDKCSEGDIGVDLIIDEKV